MRLAEELPAPAQPVADTSYAAARTLFADAGIAFPAAVSVTDTAGLAAALDGLTLPVVLKATGRLHKSDGGGVILGLADRDAARAAYADLVARLTPPAVSVEAMADLTDGVELIVGCVRDPKFGPVLMVGLGGCSRRCWTTRPAPSRPCRPMLPRDLLLALQGAPVLLGARGRSPVDLDALAEVVARVSRLAAAHPELVELELNPVLAGPPAYSRWTRESSSAEVRRSRRCRRLVGSAGRTRRPTSPWPGRRRGRRHER